MSEQTECYTYFSICSNGEITITGLQSAEAGVFDPDDITKLLDIEPFRKWKKGDERPKYNFDLGPNPSPYGSSSWSAEKSAGDWLDVNKQCLETISQLKTKLPELTEIKKRYDVKFTIHVVPKIYKENSPAIYFDSEIIEFCYLTGATIDVDMYFYGNEEPDHARAGERGINKCKN